MSKEFENIISFENLYRAHRRARLGKRHKKEVIEFEMNLSENLWQLHYELKYGTYKVSGYHSFMIYDPKKREIQAITYRDRVVQHSLCDNFLSPLLERHLIYDNVACRKNKGTSFAVKRVRQFMEQHYKKYNNNGYLVKLDISKYFLRICHKTLKNKLAKLPIEPKIFGLLCIIIDSFHTNIGYGLPMGNQTSQCFALLYLDNVDRYIKELMRVKHYIRYMDDMLLFVQDKNTATKCYNKACEVIHSNNLIVNPKSQIIPINNGFNFLGWHFFYSHTGKIIQTIKNATKKRIISNCKRYKTQPNNMKMRTRKQAVLQSYIGYLSQCNTYIFTRKVAQMLC